MKEFLRRHRDLVQSLAVLGLIFSLAAVCSPRDWRTGAPLFLQADNLTNLLRVTTPVAVVALGMTLVILTGGIDLSVGSTLGLAAVVAALALAKWHWGGAAAIATAITVGGLVGLSNGALVALLRVPPFIITLASMIGIRGLARSWCNNENIGLRTAGDAAVRFVDTWSQKPFMIGFFAGLALLVAALLRGTVFGRYVRALGDNPTAAVYAGLPIKRVQLAVYGLTGLFAGLAGVLTAARTNTGNPNDGIAAELDVIAVVVMGGTALTGGRGGIAGTVIGALIVGILANILGLRNVDANSQLMLKAGIIVLAVVLQQRRAAR